MSRTVIHLHEVDSTNEYIKRCAQQLPDRAVVYSDHQTSGKGRRGRVWEDAPEKSMLASWMLKGISGQTLQLLPFVAGVSVLDALDSFGAECALKWPNDLLAPVAGGYKKVGGILCESRPVEGFAVCGIGVNLLQDQRSFLQSGLQDATSIAQAFGCKLDRESLIERISQFIDQWIGQAGKDSSVLLESVQLRCVTLGTQVRILTGQGEMTGLAKAIGEQGELICQTENGEMKVRAGDVSVRGLYGYTQKKEGD